MNLKTAYFHYDNYEINRLERKADAINHAWLFIKCVIKMAYGIDEPAVDYDNVDIIDKFISDDVTVDNLHKIRKLRNQYQHNDRFETDFEFLKSAIDDFIRYVNENNSSGFRWKYEDQLQTGDSSHVNLSIGHILIERDSDSFFEHKDDRTEWISNNKTNIDTYPIAYGDTYKTLTINDSSSNVNNWPLLSVIHNIITRGATIPESSILIEKNFDSKKISQIYIYEILIIRFICSRYFTPGQILYYPSEDSSAVNEALSELNYYLHILGKMSGREEKLPNFAASYIAQSSCISNGQDEIRGTVSQNGEAIAPILLSSRIDYEINESNIKYYNLLLSEIFDHDTFRDGQIAALKAIFANKNNSLVILPTGYGKSLIYQFASFIQPLISIIVSPTDTLIMDQIMNLKRQSITSVATVNLDTSIPRKLRESHKFYSVLAYANPLVFERESMFNLTMSLFEKGLLNVVSIDECHQVSLYGHRFEAEYFTLLHQLLSEIPDVRLLLFSATASKRIKDDLYKQLGERRLNVIQPCPLTRDNIKYHMYDKSSFNEMCFAIRDKFHNSYETGDSYDVSNINEIPPLTLIICNSNAVIKILWEALLSDVKIGRYCGIFTGEKRIYNEFKNGSIRILITDDTHLAGINIPFLRNVIIVGYPPSKEWLYQETGRVGRDGEQANVDIYYSSNSEYLINNLIKKKYSASLPAKWEKLRNEHYEYSNLEFLYSLTFSELHISEAIRTNSDILNMVHVPTGSKYGRVAGSMKREEKRTFDYALFILFYLDIVIKWLFREENEMLRYGFSINRRLLQGTEYFSALFEMIVDEESADSKIKNKFLALKNNEFDEIITNTANWLSENGYYTRRQMLINTLQFIKSSGTSDDAIIEDVLASYFGVYAQSGSEIWEQNYDTRTNKLLDLMAKKYNTDSVHKTIGGGKFDYYDKQQKFAGQKLVDSNKTKSIGIDTHKSQGNIATSPEKSQSEQNNIKPVVIDKCKSEKNEANSSIDSQTEKNKIISNSESTGLRSVKRVDSQEKLVSVDDKKSPLLKYCTEHNEIKLDPIGELYIHIINAVQKDGFIKVQAEIERELESQSNELCETTLTLIELLYSKGKSFVYSDRFLSSYGITYFYKLLETIKGEIRYVEKNAIDNMLNVNGHSKFYYCGFSGIIRKVVDRVLRQ